MLKSYCSHHEDIMLLKFFEKKKLSGARYFVDVGANDGITGSNSYLLEKNKWEGILVEPNPGLISALSEIRTSPIITNLVSDHEGSVPFHVVSGPGNLHGLSRIDVNDEFFEHIKKHQGSVDKIEVECKTLTEIFEENKVPYDLEVLSIDVEGHELTVLKTLDFKKYQPQIILLEDNSKGADKAPLRYLKTYGYKRVYRSGVNDWYTNTWKRHFFLKSLSSNLTFIRWDLKRLLYKMVNKNIDNGLI